MSWEITLLIGNILLNLVILRQVRTKVGVDKNTEWELKLEMKD